MVDGGGIDQVVPRTHKLCPHTLQVLSNSLVWSMLKRGYHGTYYHMSAKLLDRCVT